MIFSDTGGTCGGALQKLRIVSGKPRGVFVADRRRTEERCKMHARGKIRAGGRRVRHVGVIELDPRGIFVYIERNAHPTCDTAQPSAAPAASYAE